jgi:hypothetical protein
MTVSASRYNSSKEDHLMSLLRAAVLGALFTLCLAFGTAIMRS